MRSVDTLIKHVSVPRRTRYNLFSKYNHIREDIIIKKHNVKWSSVSKRKKGIH